MENKPKKTNKTNPDQKPLPTEDYAFCAKKTGEAKMTGLYI